MKSRKTTVRILTPLRKKLDAALARACLKRDAYFNRVLEREIVELDREITTSNSSEAHAYISRSLKSLGPRDLVTLTLRDDLIAEIDSICERKLICRDAFFNRLLFLLTANDLYIDTAFFSKYEGWRADVWSECRNDGPFFRNVFTPLNPDIDPFWTIRAGLGLLADECRERRDLAPDGVYTAQLFAFKWKGVVSLSGLSCYMHDALVPRTDASKAPDSEFTKFIADMDAKRTLSRKRI